MGLKLKDLRQVVQGSTSPEQRRRQRIDETAAFLHKYSDFTNGRDSITSVSDYNRIADGGRDTAFRNHLERQNPGWSARRVDQEVAQLRRHAGRLTSDSSMLSLFDNAAKGGKLDNKISSGDLAAARLRNDISQDRAPTLSVDQILTLHKDAPVAGNEAVTNYYHHQAQELNGLLGGDSANFKGSWPAFAEHASNSAGALIRKDGALGLVGRHIAEGNRAIFADMAPRYDAYIKAAKENPDLNMDQWLAQQPNMQDKRVQDSFRFLDRARRSEPGSDQQAEFLLASNALGVAKEQEVVQPHLEAAMAPLTGTGLERRILADRLEADGNPVLRTPSGDGGLTKIDVSETLQGNPARGLDTIESAEVRRALSRALGRSEDPSRFSSGQALVNRSGTDDYANIEERMPTILGLMISHQDDPRLGEYALDAGRPVGRNFWLNLGDLLHRAPRQYRRQ